MLPLDSRVTGGSVGRIGEVEMVIPEQLRRAFIAAPRARIRQRITEADGTTWLHVSGTSNRCRVRGCKRRGERFSLDERVLCRWCLKALQAQLVL